MMDDFVSESESDYTSYWRDWVSSLSYTLPSCVYSRTRRHKHRVASGSHAASVCVLRTKVCSRWAATTCRASPLRGILFLSGPSTRRHPNQHSIMDREWVVEQPQYLDSVDDSIGVTCSDLPSEKHRRKRLKHSERTHDSGSDYTGYSELIEDSWLTDTFLYQFISSRGNEYFCEIDEEYLTDRFNLTGLNTEVQYYQYALDLVTDVFDVDCDDDMREAIEKAARHLYGLVHARYIVTTRGLGKMVRLSRCLAQDANPARWYRA